MGGDRDTFIECLYPELYPELDMPIFTPNEVGCIANTIFLEVETEFQRVR